MTDPSQAPLKLVQVAVGTYPLQPSWDVPVAEGAHRLADVLARWSAEVVDLSEQATRDRVRSALSKWSMERSVPTIVYWAGHAESSDRGYVQALSDSSGLLDPIQDLTGATWAGLIERRQAQRLEGEECNWLVVILDTCKSRLGALDIWRSFKDPPPNTAVIGTSDEAGAAFAGRFIPRLLEKLASFTGNDEKVTLRELLRRLEDDLDANPNQGKHVNYFVTPDAVLPPPPEPPFHAPVDVYAEMRQALAAASPHLRNHFYEKARAADYGEYAWHFTGRGPERRRIARWLTQADSGLLAVHGLPGSGKSALLGMVLASSDPAMISALERLHPRGTDLVPVKYRPPEGVFDAVLHLNGHSLHDTVWSLTSALGLGDCSNSEDLVHRIAEQSAGADRRVTIMADALDEARDPLPIAALLKDVSAIDKVRVLVGTRDGVQDHLDDEDHDDALIRRLTLSDEERLLLPNDPEAVYDYVESRLRSQAPGLPHERVHEIADAVAETKQPFLFARLIVHEVLADPSWSDPEADLAPLLNLGQRGLFSHATARLGSRQPTAEWLLHALAYARGRGLPRTDGIWQLVASALGNGRVNDADVEQALVLAAPYIIQDGEFGVTTYRLAHTTFAEHYRELDRATTGRQNGFESSVADALTARARQDAESDMSAYLHHYLPAHVASARNWALLADYEVASALDIDRLSAEAFRAGPAEPLPDWIRALMLAREEVRANDPGRRLLVATLAARRLGLHPEGPRCDALLWTDIGLTAPHYSFGQVGVGAISALCAFRHEGDILVAAGGDDGGVRLFSVSTGEPHGVIPQALTGRVTALCAVKDAEEQTWLIAGDVSGLIRVWQLGATLEQPVDTQLPADSDVLELEGLTLADGSVRVAVRVRREWRSGERRHRVTRRWKEEVFLWEPPAGELQILPGSAATAICPVPSPEGDLLATGGGHGTVELWDPATLRVLRDADLGFDHVTRVRATMDLNGHSVMVTAQQGRVRILELNDGPPSQRSSVTVDAWLTDLAVLVRPRAGIRLALADDGGSLLLMDPTGDGLGSPLRAHAPGLTRVCAVPTMDGRPHVVTGGVDGAVRLWDVEPNRDAVEAARAHGTVARRLTVLKDGDRSVVLASAERRGSLRLWDARTGQVIPPRAFADPRDLADPDIVDWCHYISTDGVETLAYLNSLGVMRFWPPITHPPGHAVLTPPANLPWAICEVPGSQLIAVIGAWDDAVARRYVPRIFLYDPESRSVKGQITHHRLRYVTDMSAAVVSETIFLATQTQGGGVHVWAVDRDEPLVFSVPGAGDTPGGPRVNRHPGFCLLPWGDDAPLVAVGGDDGSVRIHQWWMGQRVTLGQLEAHKGQVTSLLPIEESGERVLASAGADGTVRVWDAHTWELRRTLPLSPSGVVAMTYRDGTLFASCWDGLVALDLHAVLS